MLRALVLLLAIVALPVRAGEAVVAVASNFLTTAEELAEVFAYATGDEIRLAHGSTGRLYAQIVNGAPYDLFLAADDVRPARLLEEGKAVEVRPYALGRLVLVARAPDALRPGARVAIADPALAPYGVAALEALDALGVDPGELRLVYGDSVGQAAAMFATGNVEAAFVASAQLPGLGEGLEVMWLDGRHAPIRQDAALLGDNEAARRFLDWLGGPEARGIMAAAGYALP